MDHIIAWILLLPLAFWAMFQPLLFSNATQIEETLNLAIYEGSKDASVEGRFTEDIYKKMRDYLVENHHYEADKIEITGTETLTPRGELLTVRIEVPKPMMTLFDFFTVSDEPFFVEKTIMSEYEG